MIDLTNEQEVESEILRHLKDEPRTKVNANYLVYLYKQIGGRWDQCMCSTKKINRFYDHIKDKYDTE